MYYARAADNTILTALSTIASQQMEATKDTMKRVIHLLDYLAAHPNVVVRYHASEMILNMHSDVSYLSETKSISRLGGYYFIGSVPKKGQEIRINGNIIVATRILNIVVCSAAEAELGAHFLNLKEGKILRLVLEEMSQKQPPTPVHCDNSTAAGIANNSVKKQCSRLMEMCFFWIVDQVKRKYFAINWEPGA